MATTDFWASVGTTVAFDPLTDTLTFSSNNAANLVFTQDGADVLVGISGNTVRLASVLVGALLDANFSFADGSVVRLGAAGNQSLTGTTGADYFDISTGGVDTVSGDNGNDVIIAGSQLGASDQIAGGTGIDILRMSGSFSVTMGAATVTGIETLNLGDGTASIVLADQTVATATGIFTVDASIPRYRAREAACNSMAPQLPPQVLRSLAAVATTR